MSDVLREFVEALAEGRLYDWCDKNGVEREDLDSVPRGYVQLMRRAARKALVLAAEEQCPRVGTCPYFTGDHCNHKNVMQTTGTLKKKAEEEQKAAEEKPQPAEPTEEEMRTTAYKASVMQEEDAGADIESASWGEENWCNCRKPMWNWGNYKYRVKPRTLTAQELRNQRDMIESYVQELEKAHNLLRETFFDPGPTCEVAGNLSSPFAYFDLPRWEQLKERCRALLGEKEVSE